MKKIVAFALAGLALVGCAGNPTWNEAVFPPEPQYGMTPAPAVADVKK